MFRRTINTAAYLALYANLAAVLLSGSVSAVFGQGLSDEINYETYYQISTGAEFNQLTDADDAPLELSSEPMPVVLAMMGVDIQDVAGPVDLAIEGEIGYRLAMPHNTNRGTGASFDPACECFRDEKTEADGYGHQASFMVNVLPNVSIGDFEAFLGGGVGALWARALGEDEIVLAYQAVGRLCYEFTNALHGCADYRYFRTLEAEIDGLPYEYEGHTILFGLRYVFQPIDAKPVKLGRDLVS